MTNTARERSGPIPGLSIDSVPAMHRPTWRNDQNGGRAGTAAGGYDMFQGHEDDDEDDEVGGLVDGRATHAILHREVKRIS